jgi:hypothetical protein
MELITWFPVFDHWTNFTENFSQKFLSRTIQVHQFSTDIRIKRLELVSYVTWKTVNCNIMQISRPYNLAYKWNETPSEIMKSVQLPFILQNGVILNEDSLETLL